jgi:hypothetical protein
MSTRITKAALAAAVLCVAGTARADGLAARTADIPQPARSALARAIDADRAAHPELYDALRRVHGLRPEVYKQRRNPQPSVGPELRRLGAAAFLPMVDALAFHAPVLENGSPVEQTALVVGMLDAVGVLRDSRAGVVLRAVFEGGPAAREPRVADAAAEALGRLCGDVELGAIGAHASTGDALRGAAIKGLGECRRVESAERLASMLASATSDDDARSIAMALGVVGSSWAWKAMGPAAEAQGLAVRSTAARALVEAFVRRGGAVRSRCAAALMAVEHPDTPALLREARKGADTETAAAIDVLLHDLARIAR